MEVSQIAYCHWLFLFAALFIATVPAPARAQQPERLMLDSVRSEVWFEAKSTGGDFTGRSHAVRAWIEIDTTDFTAVRGEVEVDAASFKTGLGLRDRHLRDDLGIVRFPRVNFAVDSVRHIGAPDAKGERNAAVFGRLTVRGAQRDVQFASFFVLRGDSLQVRGSAPIKFTQFDMKPPSRLLGVARVRDDVVLHFFSLFVPSR